MHENPPVYPTTMQERDEPAWTMPGITLRDHFAGLAMQGFLSGQVAHHGHQSHWQYGDMAAEAYEVADAMLEARAS